ncbi:NAD(P)-dependent oxidoreductase [Nostocoides sp. HKS02]|uniref:NAD(P)-dependent oxidoreductase n=1 Tax=Nostocoides sp. HKS02 TaxID=1813880 RepID=UPI0012B47A7A|nr:NAD(P)-dependent oxidoreductase [Tetrasphaera sp. HKS02]QGN58833.1 NAD-binding protein [Tetrasphaera sp. HKS02]
MAQLAFLGLGQMGAPMAARLVQAGHDLTVWNRTPAKTEPLVALGAAAAASPADAAAAADVVITMLADPLALERVLFDEDGVAGVLTGGQLLIDMSTVGPDTIRLVRGRLPEHVTLVDAPVRGSVPEATSGRLSIFVGATAPDFKHVQRLLAPLGTPHHVGGPGAGAAAKLVANLVLGVTIAALGEALALGDTLGLQPSTTLDVLAETAIGATVTAKRPNIESDQYEPSFKLRHALKDLRLARETVEGTKLDLTGAAYEWLVRAAGDGAADLDVSAVVATIRAAIPGPDSDAPPAPTP